MKRFKIKFLGIMFLMVVLNLFTSCGGDSPSSNDDQNQFSVITNTEEALVVVSNEDTLKVSIKGLLDQDGDGYAQLCTLEVMYLGDSVDKNLSLNYRTSEINAQNLEVYDLEASSYFYASFSMGQKAEYDFSIFTLQKNDTLISLNFGEIKLLTQLKLESKSEDDGSSSSSSSEIAGSSSSESVSDPIPAGEYRQSSLFLGDTAKVIEINLKADGSYIRVNKDVVNSVCVNSYNIEGKYLQTGDNLNLTQTSMKYFPGCTYLSPDTPSFDPEINYEVYYIGGKDYFTAKIGNGVDAWHDFELK